MPDETFRWVITGAVAIATLCIFVMAGAVVGLYRIAGKIQAKVESVTGRVEPLIDSARALATENGPRMSSIATRAREIADNAKDVSDVAREQAHLFAEVGRDIADRTKAQVARVDSVLDETLVKAQVAGSGVKEVMMKPVREASGVMAGLKAAVSTYAAGQRTGIDHITQDEEMFI
jgi:methyl-accepting chemotaxis protein